MKKTYLKPETRKIEVKPHLMNIGSPGSQMVTATPDSSSFDDDEEFASRRGNLWGDED